MTQKNKNHLHKVIHTVAFVGMTVSDTLVSDVPVSDTPVFDNDHWGSVKAGCCASGDVSEAVPIP